MAGIYHLVRIPVDVVQASSLSNARPCYAGETGDCIEQVQGVVTGAVYHRRSAHDLVLRVDGRRVQIGIRGASWSTLANLYGSSVILSRWQGMYIYVDTSVSRLTTTDHPGSRIISDTIQGILETSLVILVVVLLRVRRRRVQPMSGAFSLSAS